jgi:hypothetical protein
MRALMGIRQAALNHAQQKVLSAFKGQWPKCWVTASLAKRNEPVATLPLAAPVQAALYDAGAHYAMLLRVEKRKAATTGHSPRIQARSGNVYPTSWRHVACDNKEKDTRSSFAKHCRMYPASVQVN